MLLSELIAAMNVRCLSGGIITLTYQIYSGIIKTDIDAEKRRAEGRNERDEEIANNMRKNGFSEEQIRKALSV